MHTNFLSSLTAVIFSHVFPSSLILIFVALYQAECYAALPFVHLLLDSTFLPKSRLATLFMHDLNTVFIFEALVTLCYFVLSLYRFECTTTFDRPLFWEVCPMHSVSVIMHVFSWNLAFFHTVTAVLFIVFCRLYNFNFFCGCVGPVRLYIS